MTTSISIIDNFFDDEWLERAMLFIKVQSRAAVWTHNRRFFPPDLVEGPGLILVNMMPNPFDEELQNYMIKKGILKQRCSFFSGLLYQGEPGSYIKWHYDGKADFTPLHRCGISVYLNEEWESSWGGWFSFQEEGETFINSYSPKFNSAVVLLKDVKHCTSPISPAATHPRITFQMFFDMESLNVEYFNK